ncbi:hypothetical protein CC80DRAFT_505495 [Byssothecium circinans]|uniref:Uncharacterized protein n=1 Tax=Byssothecium circinans TaxID=147558 RepID=A0A6A5TT93_9PLEO|nr:hypothetical protein CC80DRAFT_505495 [Byssothecium circinans]
MDNTVKNRKEKELMHGPDPEIEEVRRRVQGRVEKLVDLKKQMSDPPKDLKLKVEKRDSGMYAGTIKIECFRSITNSKTLEVYEQHESKKEMYDGLIKKLEPSYSRSGTFGNCHQE